MPMNALALMVFIGQVCVPCEHKRVNLCDHLKLLEVSSSDWWGFMGYTMELWRMFAIPTSETRLRSFQVLGIFAAFSCLLNALFLRATRGYVILSWRAKRSTKEMGRKHVSAAELQKKGVSALMSGLHHSSFPCVSPLPKYDDFDDIRISCDETHRFSPLRMDRSCLGDHLLGRHERAARLQ